MSNELLKELNKRYMGNFQEGDSNLCTNSNFYGYSNRYKENLFIKVYKEEEKFLAENLIMSNDKNSPYITYGKVEDINYIVMKYIDYEKFDPPLSIEEIYKLGSGLAEYHCNNSNICKRENKVLRTTDSFKFIDEYFVIEKHGRNYEVLNEIYNLFKEKKAVIIDEVNKLPKFVIHGDFGLRNVKLSNGDFRLIDFERSEINIAWFDFGKFFNREIRDEYQQKVFLEGYRSVNKIEEPGILLKTFIDFETLIGIYLYLHYYEDDEFEEMSEFILNKIINVIKNNKKIFYNDYMDIKSGQVMEMKLTKEDFIIKELKCKTLFDKEIMELMCLGDFYTSLCKYYTQIKNSGINVAEILNINKNNNLSITQRYIDGVNLKNYEIQAAQNKNFNNDKVNILFNYVEKVIFYQYSLYKYDQNLRLDLNTQNFIIKDKELILVDVTPPVFVDRMKLKDKDIYEIYFTVFKEIAEQWICFYGYLCKTLISEMDESCSCLLKDNITLYFNKFCDVISKVWGEGALIKFKKKIDKINTDGYGKNVYFNRIFSTFEFLSDKIDYSNYKEIFSENSFVRKYLNLD